MKISVVMATFNGESYISEQLNSILDQTVLPDELIICDDGSKDGTVSILRDYEKKFKNIIKLFFNHKNLGYSKNFWKALGYATGDIILLSDQDDVWKIRKIETIKSLFLQYPQIRALSTAYELIDANGVVYNDIRNVLFKNNGKLKNISWKKFIRHPRYPGMGMAIRREDFKSIIEQQFEEMAPHDWLLNQSAAYSSGMYFCDKILTQYRQHDNNTVGSAANAKKINYKSRRIETIQSLQDSLEFLMKHNDIIICNKMTYHDIIYTGKVIELCKQRIGYLFGEKIFKLALCDLKNYSYISSRSIIGDIYYGLRIKYSNGDNSEF